MAETTATTGPSLEASATIFATRWIHAASPTDVPPNFITCRGLFIFKRIRRDSIGNGWGYRPSATEAPQKTIHYQAILGDCASRLCCPVGHRKRREIHDFAPGNTSTWTSPLRPI